MKNPAMLILSFTLILSACLKNPTIDEEITEKCSITVSEYRDAETKLNASSDGASIHAGHCRLTRTSKDVIEGQVIDNVQ